MTEIIGILDRSGSMFPLQDDVRSGWNSFIEEQRKLENPTNVSLTIFDNHIDHLYWHTPLELVSTLSSEYLARGMTSLLDAVGSTIQKARQNFAERKRSERPQKVIVLISTDGYENASREFTLKQVKDIIEHQSEKYNWQFIFTGAAIDAYKEGGSLGINPSTTVSFAHSASGVSSLYNGVSQKIADYRSDTVYSCEFTDEEKAKIEENTNGKKNNT